ncbi:hypothetical protein H4R18_001580 [Coemansia javaensis]|uniref:Calcineurin-like phosphoesterase domain-containing protein n=1 Tax=Coemansia javaensis TaxID=2761396 RepID=A0A9W8HCF5_9FUNG|nr:hypothetical protein H4R18_001580 [Coemansia javaensis]
MLLLRRRRVLVLAPALALALLGLYVLAGNPYVQMVRVVVRAWLDRMHLYPCVFLKRPVAYVHGDDHYYVAWETTCSMGAPVFEWWADGGDGSPSVHRYVRPQYREIDRAHHRYSAIIGPVHGAGRVGYSVSSRGLSTPQYAIPRRTQGNQARVLVISDNQNGPVVFRRVLAGIQRHYGPGAVPDAILHVGDAVQTARSLDDWQRQMFSPLEDVGGYLQQAPLAFVPGNHDHDRRRVPGNANMYTDMYHGLYRTEDLGTEPVANGSYHRFYYSTRLGSARLIVLDAECPSDEQSAFLERELRSDAFQAAQFRIVAVHIPPYIEFWDPYTWNDKGERHWGEHIRLEYDRLFREHRVDLVISGHQHNYQRSTISRRAEDPASADTITYAIVGGAGGDLDRRRVENWHMYNVTYLGHHFVDLELSGSRLAWTAYDAAGSVIDRLAIARAQRPAGNKRSALAEVVTREYTIHLHKRVFGESFKKRAPRAIRVIRKFAQDNMGTKDVRIDAQLNKAVWARGIKTVPTRIRVRLARRRNDDESAAEKLYTHVSYVPVASFKGLQTQLVDE